MEGNGRLYRVGASARLFPDNGELCSHTGHIWKTTPEIASEEAALDWQSIIRIDYTGEHLDR